MFVAAHQRRLIELRLGVAALRAQVVERVVVVVVELQVQRVLAEPDLTRERRLGALEVLERHVQVAVRAQERAGVGVVGLKPLDEVVRDAAHARDRIRGRRLAGRRVRCDDHREHRVLRREPVPEPVQIADRGDVLRQQVREIRAQRQVEHRQVEARSEQHRGRERHGEPAAIEPGCIATSAHDALLCGTQVAISDGTPTASSGTTCAAR